jgi:hypothetical protein
MSALTASHPETIEGTHLRVYKDIAGPRRTKFTGVVHGNSATLTSASDPNQTIVIHLPPPSGGGSTTTDLSISGILGVLGDGLMEALRALKGLVSCTPVTTTTVNVGSDGKVTSVVTTTSCVPG